MPRTPQHLLLLLPLLFCTLLLPSDGCSTLPSPSFYVAPDGRDDHPGTSSQPFATLERARLAVRELHKSTPLPPGGVTVYLRGGLHWRMSTFLLTSQDSGTPESPVIYRSAPNEIARISAGLPIPASAFKPITDPAILARLDPAARPHLLQLPLASLGVTHTGPFPNLFSDGGGLLELYFNDTRMPLSRWPNTGYTTLARVVDKGDCKPSSRRPGAFIYRDDRPARWSLDSGIWLNGFWRVPWEPLTLKVQSLDPQQKLITFAEPITGGLGSKYAGPDGSGKEPFCAINLLEEIDQPGEWALDFKTKTLYFWPPDSLPNSTIVISDVQAPLIRLSDASHILLRDLTIESGLDNGLEIEGGSHNLAAACIFRNLAGSGAVICSGQNNGIQSCDLHDLGQSGIVLAGGDRKTLTPAHNFALNNHIHHVGILKRTYAPGILLGCYGAPDAVGNLVAHNRIHDLPHAAIIYSGNDNILEYNDIYRVALDSGDVGAFYTWKDWTSRGNILRYNFVHHAPSANAFYMDDGDSGDSILSNLICDTAYGPFVGGGHDNLIQHNLIIATHRAAIHLDSRGIARNYTAANKSLMSALNSIDYQNAPWSQRYPALTHILDHPELPTGNIIQSNILVACPTGLDLSGKPATLDCIKVQDNLELDIPSAHFENFQTGDLRLKSDSPIHQKLPTFPPIPLNQIGLQLDPYRTHLPPSYWSPPTTSPNAFDSKTDLTHP